MTFEEALKVVDDEDRGKHSEPSGYFPPPLDGRKAALIGTCIFLGLFIVSIIRRAS